MKERLNLERIFMAACVVFILAKAALFLYLSYNSMLVMDEFQQGGYPARIKEGFYAGFSPMKTVLFAYYYLPAHWLGENAFQVILIARAQTAALGLAVAGLVYLISRNIGKSALESLFNVAVLLSFSTFMERAFRVRAEPLAVFFAMSALYVLTTHMKHGMREVLAGLLSGAAFLTTQKAVYFNVALGLGIMAEAAARRSYKEVLKNAAVYTTGWAVAVIVYAFYFRGLEMMEVIKHIFMAPAKLAMHGGEYYADISRYIFQTTLRNVLAYILCFAGMIAAVARLKKMSSKEAAILTSAVAMAFFVFSHNQPWPYVFIMVLPFISLFAVDVFLAPFFARGGRKPVYMIIALAALSISFNRNIRYFHHDNAYQKKVVSQAESLLKPNDAYCDGIGMIVTRTAAITPWWDERAIRLIKNKMKEGDNSNLERVFGRQPKLWIINYRVERLQKELAPYMTGSYINIFPNIIISGSPVRSDKELVFNNRWEGVYALYSSDGERLDASSYVVNGKTVSGPVSLGLGEHIIKFAAEDEKTAFLLPYGINTTFHIPPRGKPRYLFPNMYRF